MFEALAQGASHPAVAAWLGLGTAAVAAVVVAMAWSVNARQIRLAELLARRQFPLTSGNGPAKEGAPEIEGAAAKEDASRAKPAAAGRASPAAAGGRASKVPPEVIDGPDQVVAGEQARYRVQTGVRTRWCRGRSAGAARCRTVPTRVIPVTCCLSPSNRAT